ncbi:MAG TPA: LacI family DNA-binding transcriptional regulator [Gaiellales bacterium]|jgi:LacI family transcriptional regulator
MAVTVRDVARAAGVSQATAARVLGNYGYASADARVRVTETATALGYTPNGVARALVSRATHTVGLIVGDIDNPFFAGVARGLADALEPRGYTVLLANADEDPARERRAMQALRARRVDGLVVVPAPGAGSGSFSGSPPLVLLDRTVPGVDADAVLARNTAGARRAVEHLLSLRHARIGMISDTPAISSSAERLAGYRRTLREAGLLDESLVSIGGSSQADGVRAARSLLARRDRPSALFTANNFMTYGAVLACRELGLQIPADVAIVGFDDLDWTTLVDPPLTVVSQPVGELGRIAGERLLARIAGDDGPRRRVRLDTHLIVRGSCGAAP